MNLFFGHPENQYTVINLCSDSDMLRHETGNILVQSERIVLQFLEYEGEFHNAGGFTLTTLIASLRTLARRMDRDISCSGFMCTLNDSDFKLHMIEGNTPHVTISLQD